MNTCCAPELELLYSFLVILVGKRIRGTGPGAHHVRIRSLSECNHRHAPFRLNHHVPCRTARTDQGTPLS